MQTQTVELQVSRIPVKDTGQSAKTLLLTILCVTRSPLTCMGKMDVFGSPAPDSAAIVPPSLTFLSQVFFFLYFTFSFLPAAVFARGCPGLPPPQHAGTSSLIHRAQPFPKGAACPCPQGTPSILLGGIRRAKLLLFFFLSPLLNEFSFSALGWPRLLNTPSPFPIGVFLCMSLCVAECHLPHLFLRASRYPMPCLWLPGCSLGQAEQGQN